MRRALSRSGSNTSRCLPGRGYGRGVGTGANLVTMNLTPAEVRDDYVLYKRERFIMTEDRILAAIAAEGLAPSRQSLADYYSSKKINGSAVAIRTATPAS